MSHLRLLALLLLVAVFLAACGSGGGGTTVVAGAEGIPDPILLFDGNYALAGIGGEADGVESISGLFGNAVADGAGMVSISTGANRLGLIEPIGAPMDFDYRVGLDQALELGVFGPGVSLLRGGISESGDMGLLGLGYDGEDPNLVLLGRAPDGTHDDTTIQGTWHFAGYTADNAGPFNVATWGTMDFDGAGAGSFQQGGNFEGAPLGPFNPPLTYEVFDNGTVGVLLDGANLLFGRLTGGGQVIILGGGGAAGNPPTLLVLIRQGAAMSDADLVGTFHMGRFQHDFLASDYSSLVGAMISDGMGGNGYSGIENLNGTQSIVGFSGFVSSVAPDGGLTINTGGGDTLLGAVSQDGRYVMAAGTSNAGGNPTFFFALR